MSDADKPLIEFPTEFIIKIVGRVGEDFETHIMNIIKKHFPDVKRDDYTTKLSKEANYVSISVVVWAESRAQLDSTYEELSHSPYVIMAL